MWHLFVSLPDICLLPLFKAKLASFDNWNLTFGLLYAALFFASSDYCHNMLMTFVKSLDPDQESRSGSKLFETLVVFLKELSEKKMQKFSRRQHRHDILLNIQS